MSVLINASTSSGLQITSDTSGAIQFQSNGTSTATINSSGYVGIGTTSPVAYLDVQKSQSGSTVANGFYLNTTDTVANISSIFRVDLTPSSSPIVNLVARAGGSTTTSSMGFVTRIAGTEAERMRIDSSGYMQGTVNGLGEGRIPAIQFFRLNANLAGANATGAQSIFGVGVTLVGSTQYAFESVVLLSKSAGTTSHTIGMGFGGTATINNVLYYLSSQDQTAAGVVGTAGSATTGVFLSTINTATNTTFTQAITAAARSVSYTVKGTISIGTGGTFIPQYTLSAAPGGAYSTVAGSYFAIYPLEASGSNISIGSWA